MIQTDKELVLFDPTIKKIIAEVFVGNKYAIPSSVSVFEGNLADFLEEYKDYTFDN